MAGLNLFFYLFLIFLILSCIAALKIYALKKENALLAGQLTETTVSLENTRQALNKVQDRRDETERFSQKLDMARRTTQPQPNLSIAGTELTRNSPERYRFINSLAERGMSVEEISAILAISTHEARQLLSLSKIAEKN